MLPPTTDQIRHHVSFGTNQQSSPSSLSVSIVVYKPGLPVLEEVLATLGASLDRAKAHGALRTASLWIIDNGSNDPAALDALVEHTFAAHPWVERIFRRGHGNIGYGRAHNLALLGSTDDYHLVLNPDVMMEPDAIELSLHFMEANPDAGFLTPRANDETGAPLYLRKRYPSVVVLALRGFAPSSVQRVFRRAIDHYEMRDQPDTVGSKNIPISSGCFMFLRRCLVADIGGFPDDYFLYFEDFDLSLRVGKTAAIAYVPEVRIVHLGGDAARKGLRHAFMFVRSAVTFFQTHGWKLW
jgi:GT2 family glycosyltransferase